MGYLNDTTTADLLKQVLKYLNENNLDSISKTDIEKFLQDKQKQYSEEEIRKCL